MNQLILDKLQEHFNNGLVKTYTKGTTILQAYEDPTSVSFLLEGMVEQYDITPEGNRISVNIFKPPAFFPMSWAINKTPNSYFFTALSDVKIKQSNAEQTVTFLQSNPDVLLDLLSRVYKGTDGLLRRLVLAASGIAANRLVFELLIEAYRFGTPLTDKTTLITIKQSSLAARSGLARETVSRELHKLANTKLVELTKQGIVVNTAALQDQLDFAV